MPDQGLLFSSVLNPVHPDNQFGDKPLQSESIKEQVLQINHAPGISLQFLHSNQSRTNLRTVLLIPICVLVLQVHPTTDVVLLLRRENLFHREIRNLLLCSQVSFTPGELI